MNELNTLSIESLREQMAPFKDILSALPGSGSQFLTSSRLFGMDIVEVPVRAVPKIKLSESVTVSDAFREEFNAWLIDMFGTRDISPVRPGTAYLIGNKILMRPESAVMLQNISA